MSATPTSIHAHANAGGIAGPLERRRRGRRSMSAEKEEQKGGTHRSDGGEHDRIEHGRVWEVVIELVVVLARVRRAIVILVTRLACERDRAAARPRPRACAVTDRCLLVSVLLLRERREVALGHDRRRRRVRRPAARVRRATRV